VDELVQIARWPDGSDPVLIVGHQPTLGLTAARVLTGQDLPWSIKKAAVWWLRCRDREGEGQVILQAVQSPDYL
jgi:phosphohistidine phosphatase